MLFTDPIADKSPETMRRAMEVVHPTCSSEGYRNKSILTDLSPPNYKCPASKFQNPKPATTKKSDPCSLPNLVDARFLSTSCARLEHVEPDYKDQRRDVLRAPICMSKHKELFS